ncbi:MAG: hypothetical protein CVU38_20485, partial [Chloroflexi bacterium HGW-Chloroflexi-1]
MGGIGQHDFQQGLNNYAGVADAYINRWEPTTKAGSWTNLNVRYRASVIDEHSTLLRFDLSSIPSGAYIQNATLTLWVTSRTVPTWMDIGLFPVLRAWQAGQATWNQAANGDNWNQGGCNGVGVDREETPATTVRVNVASGAVTIDVRDIVRGWVADPASNHGLLLWPVNSGATMTYVFASSEVGTQAQRPKLTVWYGGTPTPTSSPVPTGTPTLTPTPVPAGLVAYQFRQGVAGYGGTTDAQIWRYGPTTNYGNDATAWVYATTCTSDVCVDAYSDVLRFDLASLAPGSVVQSAALALCVTSGGSNSNHLKLDAYRLLRAWAEGSVTWNAPWRSPGANAVGSDRSGEVAASAIVTPQDVGQCVTLDVTTLVQMWIDHPGANWGLILRATDAAIPNGGVVGYPFGTSEHWDVAKRPNLTVILDANVTPAPPPTATPNPGPSCVKLYLEAEAGDLYDQYTTGGDSGCSACSYAYVPDGAGNNDGSMVVFTFYVPETNLYYFWGRTRAPDWSSWKQKFSIDGDAPETWPFPNVGGDWTWRRVYDHDWAPVSRNLSQGWHELRIFNEQDGAQIDAIALVQGWDCTPVSAGCATAQGIGKVR